MKGDITCIKLDNRNRKLFFGTSRGKLKTLNVKNGAISRKFKKEQNRKSTHKEDISSIAYWGDGTMLIASSWDGMVRFYDDGDAEDDCTARHIMNKHEDAVNFTDFRAQDCLSASCGDDGIIHIFNYKSLRAEGQMENVGLKGNLVEMKVCKFLAGTDLLVTSDLEGYLKFWCVASKGHPLKNKLVFKIRDESPGELRGLAE